VKQLLQRETLDFITPDLWPPNSPDLNPVDYRVYGEYCRSVLIGKSIYYKAFDSISHPKLIHKLKSYGISGNVLGWIENFLSGCTQCTRVGSSVSNMQYLSSGVIQGSCLGPLLFVLYINDVVKLFDEHCVAKLSADDLKMYMDANLPDCTTTLQGYLDKLATWSDTWQLTISCKKCSVLQVGKGENNQVYCLTSQPITATDVVKDLGVYVMVHIKTSLK